MGASLLVLKNKSDVPGCMSEDDVRKVRTAWFARLPLYLHISDSKEKSIR